MKTSIAKHPLLIAAGIIMLFVLAGCMSMTPAERAEVRKEVVKAAVQPGTDKRCVGAEGLFQFCYTRERAVDVD
jgi:hypothetical protein